jgi:shikimate kinase
MSKIKKIICIVGMMGVGKTTVGAKLAKELGYYFTDSDREIEDSEGDSISYLFANKGEDYFRIKEFQIISQILQREEYMIVSLGGGAFINENLQEIITERANSIWLKASATEILQRIKKNNNRPLLNHKDKLKIINSLISARYPIYQKADYTFETSDISCDKLVKKIIDKLELKKVC